LPRVDWPTALRGLLGFAVGLALWVNLSPLYDRLVAAGAEPIVRAFENPMVTRLHPTGDDVRVDRSDFDPRSPRPGIQTFQLTFNWVLLVALFALDPRPLSLGNLRGFALASLALGLTHVLALVAEVMNIYVLRLGAWSRVHYGPVARNFWSAASHSYRFVLMFAIAFGLWWGWRPGEPITPAAPAPKRAAASRKRSARRRR
jgi:hypothetical protein